MQPPSELVSALAAARAVRPRRDRGDDRL